MKTTTALLIGIALLSTTTMARAQEPIGVYTLERAGHAIGTVSIEALDGTLVLTTRMTDGTPCPTARRTTGRTFQFASAVPTNGLSGALTGAATPPANATWTVELTPGTTAGTYRARISANGTVIQEERLVRAATVRAALFVHADAYSSEHKNAFQAYATQTATRYRQAGYSRTDLLLGTGWDVVIAKLLEAERERRPYERLIFVGHGGWDGPILSGQVSSHSDPETFAKFIDALRRGTTPSAKIFASSCHSGGSNRYEAANTWNNTYRWVDDVSDLTGRTAAGPMGYTSTEFTEQQVFAALEGQGTTRQDVRWASPQGVRVIRAGGTLAGAALTKKEPITRPAPVVAETVATTGVNLPLGVGH